MSISLTERLGFSPRPVRADESRTDAGLMARSLMYLYAAGATITLLSLLMPSAPVADEARIVVTAASAYSIAAILLAGYDRVPSWAFQVFLACGTMLIEWAIYSSGDSTSPYAMFYFWIAIYAFYFFSTRQAALQIFIIGVAYAAVLSFADEPSSPAVVRWGITTSALIVAGALIGLLRSRVDRLIGKLADAARTDALTGLANRRGFQEALEVEFARAHRTGRPFSLVIGDLDGFKRVNDRFGHQAGDEALERVAALLLDGKRRIDAAARIGGEEFALVLPDTDEHGGYVAAERQRRAIREGFAGEPLPLTISLGVASFPKHGHATEDLLHAADRALYLAKELGRDRAVMYHAAVARSLTGDAVPEPDRAHNLDTVLTLAETLDLRDGGTADHSHTVGRYAEACARALGLPPDQVERVRLGGVLHDIGKVGVPDSVLRKPGPLTEDEWAVMRKHPELGARILRGAHLDDVSEWVLAHHERPDGRGYPRGLGWGEVPVEARILAVADAYEAMTSDRVYREAIGSEAAREELRRCAGSQFDPRIVRAFLTVVEAELLAA